MEDAVPFMTQWIQKQDLYGGLVPVSRGTASALGQGYRRALKKRYGLVSKKQTIQQYKDFLRLPEMAGLAGDAGYPEELFFLLFPIRWLTYDDMRERLLDDENTALWNDMTLRRRWQRQGFNPDMMINSRGEDILCPMIFTAMDFIDDDEIEDNPHFVHEQKKQIFHLRRVVRELYDANRDTILRAVESMSHAIVVRSTTYDQDGNQHRLVRIYAPLSEDQIKNVVRVLTYVLFRFPTQAV